MLELFVFTHDSNDEPPVKWLHSNAEQEEPDRYLGKTDSEEVQGLCDEIELERCLEVRDLNVLDVSSSAVVDLGDDDALSSNALKIGQSRVLSNFSSIVPVTWQSPSHSPVRKCQSHVTCEGQ